MFAGIVVGILFIAAVVWAIYIDSKVQSDQDKLWEESFFADDEPDKRNFYDPHKDV